MAHNLRLTGSTIPASEFGPAPRDVPGTYPGQRPSSPYMLHRGDVHVLDDGHDDIRDTLDDELSRLGFATIDKRHPIIGYGSNTCPAQLVTKFGQDHAPIIVVNGWLDDHDVVYMPKISKYGAIPAAIDHSPGTSVQVGVTLLDDAQLEAMSSTEPGHELVEMDRNISSLGTQYRCRYYKSPSMLIWEGRPVRISEITAVNSRYGSMPQREVLDHVAQLAGLHTGAELARQVRSDRGVHARVNKILEAHSAPVTETGSYPDWDAGECHALL